MQSSDLHERLATQGADIALLSGATYSKFVTDETARWSQVVQAAGIQPL
jgi:tripartite-type tricarboxylate transporter receptor subunit TctC